MENFVGTFKLEKSENFDEYLQKRGINWMLRQMMKMASNTKIIEKVDENSYKLTNQTSMKTLTWGPFKLGQPIEASGFDDKKHRISWSLVELPDGSGSFLLEKHVRIEENDHEEVYKYERDGDQLIINMEAEGVQCRRFFKKQ